MDPIDNPNNPASNNPEHDPAKGGTVQEQQANAAREERGKEPLPNADTAKSQESPTPAPIANATPPTVSPASAQQISANLVQTTTEFSGFGEAAADGKSTATLTLHIVRQPNDARSDQAILFAALQDEYEKARRAA